MRMICYVLLYSTLAVLGLSAYSVAVADVDAAPGKSASRAHKQWTRIGELEELPERTSDELPLSDQGNRGDWEIYTPLTDEFAEQDLDETKWIPRHRNWRGRQPAWFSPENVIVSEGQLQLSMKFEEPPEELRSRGYHTYSSAAVHSLQPVKYGYFEVRAQPIKSAGSSSFWFAGSDGNWRTEIDVFELGGKAVGFERKYNMNLHVFHTPVSKEHWNVGGHWIAPWQFADAFHVYGLEWNDKEISYFVDGVPVRRVENTHWKQPIYMIFDSETMPKWLGIPSAEDLPSTFRIEYVRCWKRRQQAVNAEN